VKTLQWQFGISVLPYSTDDVMMEATYVIGQLVEKSMIGLIVF